ncbi:MAG: ABC transporter ATP-binding protein [Acidimicrobiales bacterium]|nr:MAG: ABC transporter ATP-binding protein [Acidimicrobiales bacterium]
MLLDDVGFRVGEGEHAALVGANGAGKSTIMRLIAGTETAAEGTISVQGSMGVMTQLVGSLDEAVTARDLYVSLASVEIREAASRLADTEAQMAAGTDDGMKYAKALDRWGGIGGYDEEVRWEECAHRVTGRSWAEVADRSMATFSGGEQKRMALEYLLRSEHEVLLLDEPDNFLDVPGKEWLADRLRESAKTILYVSHDRELLAATSDKVVTIEAHGAWTHGGSFATWREAREHRLELANDEQRRWAEERKRLVRHMREQKRRAAMSDANASRARAAETRLRHFDDEGPPPEAAKDQHIEMRLAGGRTGKRVVIAEQLELSDLTFPFDLEIWFGERVAVVGRNGTGKSHFLRLLGHWTGEEVDPSCPVAHEGAWKLGARVVPGLFNQTHDQPELVGRTILEILADRHLARGSAMSRLRRYELQGQADQPWETLSGGQQARFQILLLEIDGANLLLLDEPTDNLDVASAEALEAGLEVFEGTVVCVTHDRWFLRSFDRFVAFTGDNEVVELDDPADAWAS